MRTRILKDFGAYSGYRIQQKLQKGQIFLG